MQSVCLAIRLIIFRFSVLSFCVLESSVILASCQKSGSSGKYLNHNSGHLNLDTDLRPFRCWYIQRKLYGNLSSWMVFTLLENAILGVKNHLHIRGVTHKPIRAGEESIKISSFASVIWGGGYLYRTK